MGAWVGTQLDVKPDIQPPSLGPPVGGIRPFTPTIVHVSVRPCTHLCVGSQDWAWHPPPVPWGEGHTDSCVTVSSWMCNPCSVPPVPQVG